MATKSYWAMLTTTWHHVYSIWLFTFSDLKTIVFPQSLFGILTALSQNRAVLKAHLTPNVGENKLKIAFRVPLVFFWVYINLLPFEINNQRQPESIREDRLNKPWRTMPSGKWTPTQALCAMLFFYLTAGLVSWQMGGLRWSLSLMVLGCWYNNLGGSDMNALVRNLINSLGYTCFGIGSLEIALNAPLNMTLGSENVMLCSWITLVALVVMTTVHTQDMEDQKGDAQRGRCSLPLQVGDGPARWITATFMLIWAPLCPYFWDSGWLGYVLTAPLALMVAFRCLIFRGIKKDKKTFILWNIWIMSIYLLPVL
ncbi:UbiA prenyltransferase family [Xylaria castorea]|nr:UbiA prenyltransferase family [Xylaria castorea]